MTFCLGCGLFLGGVLAGCGVCLALLLVICREDRP